MRKTIYTNNPIEGMHRQMSKIKMSKDAFSSEKALMKLISLIIKDIPKKWIMLQLYIKLGNSLNFDIGF